MQALQLMLMMLDMSIVGGEVFLVGDLDACDDSDDLCDSEEIYLTLFLLDIQDFFLHAHVHKIYQLTLIKSLLLHD